ncbi:hypothetical protein Leryth_000960 [Lithospermum erythrorhizon]|nr:hypothetical protein Leryth_000960 [Lithospermum erythrorhizon]
MEIQKNTEVQESYEVRKLHVSDKDKGFINLLEQLTLCGNVTNEDFIQRFEEISRFGDNHVVFVIEDIGKSKIVATGSVIIESKFIRNCGKAGHIEDVVVDSGYRGKQLGKKMIEFLVDHCVKMGCYKVILDCSEENACFYQKCGFNKKAVQMAKYFDT